MTKWLYANANPVMYVDPNGLKAIDLQKSTINPRDLTKWLYDELTWKAKNNGIVRYLMTKNDWACTLLQKAKEASEDCNQKLADLNFSLAAANHAEALGVFFIMVRDGGPWDFKDEIGINFGPGITLCSSSLNCSENIEYSVPGNIHYGYIGLASGFSVSELKWGAGWAKKHDPSHDGKSSSYSGPYLGNEDYSSNDSDEWNYGDEPSDNNAVTLGVKLWRNYGKDMTYSEYQSILAARISGLDHFLPLNSPVSPAVMNDWPYPVGYFNNKGRPYVPNTTY